jgi:hypothetical protein
MKFLHIHLFHKEIEFGNIDGYDDIKVFSTYFSSRCSLHTEPLPSLFDKALLFGDDPFFGI